MIHDGWMTRGLMGLPSRLVTVAVTGCCRNKNEIWNNFTIAIQVSRFERVGFSCNKHESLFQTYCTSGKSTDSVASLNTWKRTPQQRYFQAEKLPTNQKGFEDRCELVAQLWKTSDWPPQLHWSSSFSAAWTEQCQAHAHGLSEKLLVTSSFLLLVVMLFATSDACCY